MKAINQQAKRVMDTLTENMDTAEGEDRSRRINNADGTFMTVHIELLNRCKLGHLYSIAHYFEQNGDMMRDPDMEFIKGGDGEYYPISFWQDSPPLRDEAVNWKDGEIVGYREQQQARLVTFANTWMKNIKEQQGL